ncbi:MAG: DUF6744 family protein [Moorellaceae bacterium]
MNLKDKVAVDEKDGHFLGRLCWYTIHEQLCLTRDQLEDMFDRSGVDTKFLPNPVREVDVFRRATGRVEKNGIPLDKDRSINVLIREVNSSRDGVARQIVVEVVDSKNVRLSYTPAVTLLFMRKTGRINTIVHVSDPVAEEAARRAEELYEALLGKYEGDHIRRMVNGILSDMKPTAVRPSGGVYFVPEKYRDELFALERLVRLLECEFFTIPVVDSLDSREMVKKKLEDQVMNAIAGLADALKQEGLTQKQVVALMEETKKLIADVEEYEALLEKDLSELRHKVGLLKMQAVELLNKETAA